jgi:hypothetical protein
MSGTSQDPKPPPGPEVKDQPACPLPAIPRKPTCPLCGEPLLDRHCNLMCPNCGYTEDCSELFPEQ